MSMRVRDLQQYLSKFTDGQKGTAVSDLNIYIETQNGHLEEIRKREELIQRETFKNGDRVRSYIYEVKNDAKAYQVFLSRTHPQFLAKLFYQEVPEIDEGIIQVKTVARDPGSRAKISVFTQD